MLHPHSKLTALAPLPAAALGAWVAYRAGVEPKAFITSVLGIGAGLFFYFLLGPRVQALLFRRVTPMATLAILFLASTLASPGLGDVHRWVSWGNYYVNASMIIAPIILYGVYISFVRRDRFLPLVLIAFASAIHVLQPDAGQSTAFGCACIVLLLLARGTPVAVRLVGVILVAIGTLLARSQPDTLPAVEHSERILHLVVKQGGVAVIGMIGGMICLFAPLLRSSVLAVTFSTYLAAQFAVTEFGNYPVPVFGAGAASIIGWYLMARLR
ncbi:hypothetical protein K2X30_10410 [bacterium]|jgi:cell division protein FtsW (lipid II flippase)|nr:hypothetical protein [bacterium]